MVFDKYVELEISGKMHKLCYPVKMVFEAERHLTDGNLLVLVSKAASGVPPTVYDMFVLIKYALMGGDPRMRQRNCTWRPSVRRRWSRFPGLQWKH